MSNLRIPRELYSERSHLYGAMKKVIEGLRAPEHSAEEIVRILPKDLKEAPAFKDALTKKWRYDFGEPYSIENAQEYLLGTDQCPLVEWLYRCIVSMQKVLTNSQLIEYLERLGDASKHLEALIECSPLLVLKRQAEVNYEVVGYGQGNKKIDFYIEHSTGISVLIDAKCRIRELIRKLPESGIPSPKGLFKSLPEKFIPQDPSSCLQGGWIHSVLKYHQSVLQSEFDRTDSSRLHFAILACWDKQAYILSRDSNVEQKLRLVFHLPNDDSIVIRD